MGCRQAWEWAQWGQWAPLVAWICSRCWVARKALRTWVSAWVARVLVNLMVSKVSAFLQNRPAGHMPQGHRLAVMGAVADSISTKYLVA